MALKKENLEKARKFIATVQPFADKLSPERQQALARLQQEVSAWEKPTGGTYNAPRRPGDPISKQEARGPISTEPITSKDATVGEHLLEVGKNILGAVGAPTSWEEVKKQYVPGRMDIPGTDRYVPLPPPVTMPVVSGATRQAEGHAGVLERANKAKGFERGARTVAAVTPVIGPLAEGAADAMTPAIAKSMLGEASTKEEQLALTGGGTQVITALASTSPRVQKAASAKATKVGKGIKARRQARYEKAHSPQGPAALLQGSVAKFLNESQGMEARTARGEHIGLRLREEFGGTFPTEEMATKRLQADRKVIEQRLSTPEAQGAVLPEDGTINAILKDVTRKTLEEVGGQVSAKPTEAGLTVLNILEDANKNGWTKSSYEKLKEIGAGPPPEIKQAAAASKKAASTAARRAESAAKNAQSAQKKLEELPADAPPEKVLKAQASAQKAAQVAQDAAAFAQETSAAYAEAAAQLEQNQSFALPKNLRAAIEFVENTRRLNNGLDLNLAQLNEAKIRATKSIPEAAFSKAPSEAAQGRAEVLRGFASGLRNSMFETAEAHGMKDLREMFRRNAELEGISEITRNRRIASETREPMAQTVMAPAGTGLGKVSAAGVGGTALGAAGGLALSGGPLGMFLGGLVGLPIGAYAARMQRNLWTSPEFHQRLANIRMGMTEPAPGTAPAAQGEWFANKMRQGGAAPPPGQMRINLLTNQGPKPPRTPRPPISGGSAPDKAPSGKSTQYNKPAARNIPVKGTFPQRRTASAPSTKSTAIPELIQRGMAAGAARDNGKSIRAFWKEHGRTLEGIDPKEFGWTEKKRDWLRAKGTREVGIKEAIKTGEAAPPPKKPVEPQKSVAERLLDLEYAKRPQPRPRKPAEQKTQEPKAPPTEKPGKMDKGTSRSEFAQETLAKELTPEQLARMKKVTRSTEPAQPIKLSRAEAEAELERLRKGVKEKVAAGDVDGAVADTTKAEKLEEALKKRSPNKAVPPPSTSAPVAAKSEAPIISKDVADMTPAQRAAKLAQYKDELARAEKNNMQGDKPRRAWLKKRIADIEAVQKEKE